MHSHNNKIIPFKILNKTIQNVKPHIQNGTCITIIIQNLTIRMRSHNNKNIQFTRLNKSIQNIKPYIHIGTYIPISIHKPIHMIT